ncbi:MAG: M20/M25/M40 family metallo-hydrolase [Elusimicrobiota bacterium]
MTAMRILAAVLLTVRFAAAAPHGDFDQGVLVTPLLEDARQSAKTAPDEGALWISLGSSDLVMARATGLPLGSPVRASDSVAVFEVSPDLLPRLSDFMHETFGRCGGFFAYRTRVEAESALSARTATKGGAYTLDQQAWVAPLVSRVSEGEIRSTIETLAAYQNRYYTADSGVEAARWLHGRWSALAAGLPGASSRLVKHGGWKQPSVVLTITGAEKPDEIVILGGHLDSINGYRGSAARAPGADDNASGIAVLTEVVRVLGASGLRPRRTIQFMGYAAEEVGLRGSQDLAKQAAREGRKVIGVIQFDMTNFKGAGSGIFLLNDYVDPGLTAFLGKLIEAYADVPWSTTKCGYACSDHASWTKSGYPAAAAFESSVETMNRSIHTDRDTLAASGGSAQHSVAFAKLAVAFAVELAKTSPVLELTSQKR